jgi:hypothetical protein
MCKSPFSPEECVDTEEIVNVEEVRFKHEGLVVIVFFSSLLSIEDPCNGDYDDGDGNDDGDDDYGDGDDNGDDDDGDNNDNDDYDDDDNNDDNYYDDVQFSRIITSQ